MNRRGITDYIELQLRAVLGLRDDFALEPDRELGHYGMNSIAGARFCYVLSNELGREISAKVLLDNYTIEKLARCFEQELQLGALPWERLANDLRSRASDAAIQAGSPRADFAASAPIAGDVQAASPPEPLQHRKQALVDDILRKLRR